jgi:hypothetical protein
MANGSSNTLRILGIIATVLIMIPACGFLLLLSLCAGMDHSHPGAAVPFVFGAFAVLVAGIWIIVLLSRGMMRAQQSAFAVYPSDSTSALSESAVPPPSMRAPLHVTREGLKAMEFIVYALAASLLFSFINFILNQLFFSQVPRSVARGKWLWIQVAVVAIYNLPYAILLYRFLKKPARWDFHYAAAIPAVMVLFTLYYWATLRLYYMHNPRAFTMTMISSAIDIAIMVAALKAMPKNGVKADSSSLVVAGIVAFVYFLVLHNGTALVYRLAWR